MAAERQTLFLAPHYDDVALSCGGTVAALAEAGSRPLILTVFGGQPAGPLNPFARRMHQQWGVGPSDAVEHRRREDICAAERLGAHARWLERLDAIYRGDRYTSDEQLFGAIAADEFGLGAAIADDILHLFTELADDPVPVYVPLGIGNHVDHQHVRAVGRTLIEHGFEVWAYEDFPYAGDPDWRDRIDHLAEEQSSGESRTHWLTPEQLEARVAALLCYASQHAVIFRHQGDPAEATRRYANAVGRGRPAERFWRLSSSPVARP